VESGDCDDLADAILIAEGEWDGSAGRPEIGEAAAASSVVAPLPQPLSRIWSPRRRSAASSMASPNSRFIAS